MSGAQNAKRGIRTLERLLTVTRVPVVRLRPAQPSLHIKTNASDGTWTRTPFEHTPLKRACLPIPAHSQILCIKFMHHRGLEPRTHWLRVSCSTNWANGAYKCRHLSIFPGRRQPSIFDVKELNFCVRNGNRWNLFAISTDYLLNWIYSDFYSHYFFSYKLLSNTLGKALDRLVPARLTPHSAYTLGLSTS